MILNARPRRSRIVVALLGLLALALTAELAVAGFGGRARAARLGEVAGLVGAAGLTDLALFTEARYGRHPAMADLHSPFQDLPMAFEHFPTGSFAPRPEAGFGQGWLSFDAEAHQ